MSQLYIASVKSIFVEDAAAAALVRQGPSETVRAATSVDDAFALAQKANDYRSLAVFEVDDGKARQFTATEMFGPNARNVFEFVDQTRRLTEQQVLALCDNSAVPNEIRATKRRVTSALAFCTIRDRCVDRIQQQRACSRWVAAKAPRSLRRLHGQTIDVKERRLLDD